MIINMSGLSKWERIVKFRRVSGLIRETPIVDKKIEGYLHIAQIDEKQRGNTMDAIDVKILIIVATSLVVIIGYMFLFL